jgi:hypothetical protein
VEGKEARKEGQEGNAPQILRVHLGVQLPSQSQPSRLMVAHRNQHRWRSILILLLDPFSNVLHGRLVRQHIAEMTDRIVVMAVVRRRAERFRKRYEWRRKG